MLTYVIRQSHHSLSLELSEDAEEALVAHGQTCRFFEGFPGEEAISFFQRRGLLKGKDPTIKWNKGTMGCFISHFLLWEECVDMDVPIVIMEHDAVMVRNPTSLIPMVEDVCHLDTHIPFNSQNGDTSTAYRTRYEEKVAADTGTGVEPYPLYRFYGKMDVTGRCFVGAYAYLLTPRGAQKLIDFVYQYGVYPADKAICERAVTLQRAESSHAKLHPFFDSIEKQRQYTTRVD